MELSKFEIKEDEWIEQLYSECVCKYVLKPFLKRYEGIVDKCFSKESMKKFILEKGDLYVENQLYFKLNDKFDFPLDYIENNEERLVAANLFKGVPVEMIADYAFESDDSWEFLVEFEEHFELHPLIIKTERIISKELSNFIESIASEYYECREGFNEAFEKFEKVSKKRSRKDLTVDRFMF